MCTDLFSSMDSNTSNFMWIVPLLFPCVFIFNKSFLMDTGVTMFYLSTKLFNNERGIPSKLLLTSLFFFLLSLNILGLTPFTFSVTTNLFITSSFALLLWGLVLFSGWMYSPKKSAAHLSPSGAPTLLLPFLIIIETISVLIRPLTLTVRLVANISAGHIIMTLISNVLSSLPGFTTSFFLFFLMVFYTLFEVFVSVIQAYIFTLLISLYMEEHP